MIKSHKSLGLICLLKTSTHRASTLYKCIQSPRTFACLRQLCQICTSWMLHLNAHKFCVALHVNRHQCCICSKSCSPLWNTKPCCDVSLNSWSHKYLQIPSTFVN